MKIFSWSCYNVLNILAATLDIFKTKCEAFIRKLAEGGVNHFRFFPYATWKYLGSFDEKWGPFLYLRDVDSGYNDGQKFSFWAVTKWNEEWWDRFRIFLALLKKYSIKLWLTPADSCSIKRTGAAKRTSYYYSCEEKYYPEEMGTEHHKFAGGLWDQGWQWLWEAFWNKLLTEVQAAGHDDFLVELMNEGSIVEDGYGKKGDTEEQKKAKADAAYRGWCERTVAFWTGRGIPKSRLVSTSGRLPEEVAAMVAPGLVSAHGHSTAQDIANRISGADKRRYVVGMDRLLVSFDGCYKAHGNPDFQGYRSPSAAEALGIGQKIVAVGARGVDGYGHEIEGPGTVNPAVRLPGSVPDLDRLDTNVVDAFRRGLGLSAYKFVHYCARSGKLVGPDCPADQDVFNKFEAGQEPIGICDYHVPAPPIPPTPPAPVKKPWWWWWIGPNSWLCKHLGVCGK